MDLGLRRSAASLRPAALRGGGALGRHARDGALGLGAVGRPGRRPGPRGRGHGRRLGPERHPPGRAGADPDPVRRRPGRRARAPADALGAAGPGDRVRDADHAGAPRRDRARPLPGARRRRGLPACRRPDPDRSGRHLVGGHFEERAGAGAPHAQPRIGPERRAGAAVRPVLPGPRDAGWRRGIGGRKGPGRGGGRRGHRRGAGDRRRLGSSPRSGRRNHASLRGHLRASASGSPPTAWPTRRSATA